MAVPLFQGERDYMHGVVQESSRHPHDSPFQTLKLPGTSHALSLS